MARRKKISDILVGTTSGAAAGATVGSAFPGWGTAIGGVAGGILGGLSGFFAEDEVTPEDRRYMALRAGVTEEQLKDMKLENAERRRREKARASVAGYLGARMSGARLGRGLPLSQRGVV